MSFTEEQLTKMDAAADHALSRIDEIARVESYGPHGEHTPPGMVRLKTPEERALWVRHLQRQALMEQEATAPGDTANAALEHPAVATAFAMQGQNGVT